MARKIVSGDIRPAQDFEDGSSAKLIVDRVSTNRVIIKKVNTSNGAQLDVYDLPICDADVCLNVANWEFGAVAAPVTPVTPPVIPPVVPTPPAPNPNPGGGYPKPGDNDYDPGDIGNIYNPDNPDSPYYVGPNTGIVTNQDETEFFNNPTS
jgi:hypothetical protein